MAVLVLFEAVPKADCMPALVKGLESGLPQTRAADGCHGIRTYVEKEGRSLVAVEHWESKEHYERYLAWRVESGVMEALGRLLEGPPRIRFFDPLEA